MKIIRIIIPLFIITLSILFSSRVFASVTECPNNPAKASASEWTMTQPLPTIGGQFSQATVIAGNIVYCHYNPQKGYFGFLYSNFTINAKSLNPQYWSLNNCHGMGLMCCNQSVVLCSFTEQ